MSGNFYFKNKFKDRWAESAKKENRFKYLIRKETNITPREVGFGTGSSRYIHANAEDMNIPKNYPDFQIPGTNIFIEVTGPLKDDVPSNESLWINIGKVESARELMKTKKHDTFAALNFPSDNTWLCIHMDDDFFKEVEKFDIVERGYQKFYAVPNDSRFVKKIWHLTNYIKKAVRKTKKNKYY